VTPDPPDGWEEIFDGACLQAEVLQAVLEANGLKPVMRQLEAADLLPTVGFDRCRIYVTDAEAASARELLQEADGA
jgi:Putative prokaryotic signal transducing protein